MSNKFFYWFFGFWAASLTACLALRYFYGVPFDMMRNVSMSYLSFGLGWTMAAVNKLTQKARPNTFEIPAHRCICGNVMNRTTATVKVRKPKDGDASICIKCAKIWVFNNDLTMREPSAADIESFHDTGSWGSIEQGRAAILLGKKPPDLPNTQVI